MGSKAEAVHVEEDRPLEGYALSLQRRNLERFYVLRWAWWFWDGDVIRMNPVRVSGLLDSRDAAGTFCRSYTAEHKNCWTETQARKEAGLMEDDVVTEVKERPDGDLLDQLEARILTWRVNPMDSPWLDGWNGALNAVQEWAKGRRAERAGDAAGS